jgi:hypothetical protein
MQLSEVPLALVNQVILQHKPHKRKDVADKYIGINEKTQQGTPGIWFPFQPDPGDKEVQSPSCWRTGYQLMNPKRLQCRRDYQPLRQALPEGDPGNNERRASLHQSGSAGNPCDPDADEEPGLNLFSMVFLLFLYLQITIDGVLYLHKKRADK